MSLNIIYEDKSIIVCNKSPGVSSQDERSIYDDMVSLIKKHINQKTNITNPYVGVIHRLDKPVSGVMVYAKTPKAAAHLSNQLQQSHMKKKYYCIVNGHLNESEGTLEHYLKKNGKLNRSEISNENSHNSKKAILSYETLKHSYVDLYPITLIRVTLQTGRHHQIRVQLNAHGFPLWGDSKYNIKCSNKQKRDGLALCAYQLSFQHPITNKEMTFSVIPEYSIFNHFEPTIYL